MRDWWNGRHGGFRFRCFGVGVQVPHRALRIHHPTARVSAFQADDAGSIPAGCSITIGAFVYLHIEYTTLASTPIGVVFSDTLIINTENAPRSALTHHPNNHSPKSMERALRASNPPRIEFQLQINIEVCHSQPRQLNCAWIA